MASSIFSLGVVALVHFLNKALWINMYFSPEVPHVWTEKCRSSHTHQAMSQVFVALSANMVKVTLFVMRIMIAFFVH